MTANRFAQLASVFILLTLGARGTAGDAAATPAAAPPTPAREAPPAREGAATTSADLLALVPEQLRYRREELPPDENAFPLWQQAFGELVDTDAPEDAFYEALWEDAGFPEGEAGQRLAEWLGRNAEALALSEDGIARGKCQFPEVTGPDARLPYLRDLRRCARLRLARAKMLAASGEWEAAGDEITSVVRLGELTRDGEGVLIVYLVGTAIESVGLAGARWLASQDDMPREVLARLLAGIAPSAGADASVAMTLRVELCSFMVSGLAAAPQVVDKAAAVAAASECFGRQIESAAKPWLERTPEPDSADAARLLRPLLPALERVLERSFLRRTEREITRAFLAVRLYHLREGKLPDSLDDLVEEGISPALPMDPFAGKPLLYDPGLRLIWSVGADGVDDGAQGRPLDAGDPDYVLLIPPWPER